MMSISAKYNFLLSNFIQPTACSFCLAAKATKKAQGLRPLTPIMCEKLVQVCSPSWSAEFALDPMSANSVLFQIHSHITILISSSFHTIYRQHTRHAH